MRDVAPRDRREDIPNVAAPPPLIFGIPLLLGLLANRWWPQALLPRPWPVVAGLILVSVSVLVLISALRAFKRARTNPKPWKPTTALVRNGPYRVTRNPMYVGFASLYLGVTLWANAAWPLVALPAVLVVMDVLVIQREERYLSRMFGDEYAEYARRVRRWL